MNLEFRLTGIDNLSPVVNGAFGKVESAVSSLRGKMSSAFSRIKDSVFSLQGAFAGIGVAAIAKDFLDTAVKFENFNTQLITIEGSSQKAKKSLDWITNFTAKTPYELDQVTEAYVRLRGYGLDPTNGLLETLGNTASAMNKPLMQAVDAMADAVAGNFERLKEFGIKARTEGDKAFFAWSDASGRAHEKIAANNAASIQSTLTAIWNDKYSGGMERMSGTWAGMMSNLKDQWELFKLRIMETGLFEHMKDSLSGLLSKISEWAENGQLQAWATQVGQAMKTAFDTTVAMFTFIKDNWETVKLLAEILATMWAVNKLAVFASSVTTLIGLFGSLRTAMIAINGISFAGTIGNLGALATKATGVLALLGQLGFAAAAGYGVGTLLDKAYTYFSGQSLGEDIYDWTHSETDSPEYTAAVAARDKLNAENRFAIPVLDGVATATKNVAAVTNDAAAAINNAAAVTSDATIVTSSAADNMGNLTGKVQAAVIAYNDLSVAISASQARINADPYGGAIPSAGDPRAGMYYDYVSGNWQSEAPAYDPTMPAFGEGAIPMMATGGIVDRATRLVAGEAGPEAFVPLDGGRAIPVTVNWGGLASTGESVGGWGSLGTPSRGRGTGGGSSLMPGAGPDDETSGKHTFWPDYKTGGKSGGNTYILFPDAKVVTESGVRELTKMVDGARYQLHSRGKI